MQIATLIAEGRLDDRLVDRALGLLRELDPTAAFRDWIDEGDAADLGFDGDTKRGALGARWRSKGVDIVVQPAEPRWKRLFVADMDSTIIGQECIDELADYAGLKDEVAGDHRAGDAGRARFQRRAGASGCGCSPGSTSGR